MKRVLTKLRRYLVTGVIVIVPIGVTLLVLNWVFQRLDPILGQRLPAVWGYRLPGLGLLALLAILVVVGWVSQRAVGRKAVRTWEAVLSRVPVARTIYGGSSQIARAVLDREENLFRACAMVEFPVVGVWALGFETAPVPAEVEEQMGEPGISVFLPTAPNPTSGFLLLVPERRVRRLAMSVEEGVKMVLSAGVAYPGAPAVTDADLQT